MVQDTLLLRFRGEPLREFPIRGSVAVGRGAYCDVVVHDADVPLLAGRFFRRDGGVYFEGVATRARPIGIGMGVSFGAYELVRVRTTSKAPDRSTHPMTVPDLETRLSVLVGEGPGATVHPLDLPLTVGSHPECDLRLLDKTVSRQHCVIEPCPLGGAIVRDLESRNGTWVEARRISKVKLGAGAMIHVGRTALRLVARGDRGDGREQFVAASPRMLGTLAEVERYAALEWPVLVLGETGAGKEGIARALHDRGPRRSQPFVALNAGALTASLVESELFGHDRGAFSGAVEQHRGVFEQAHGGTLFLDEVGELPLALQARLLRVLETWRVRRVGSETERHVDVRLVCATHRDLRAMTALGTFRTDLLFRLLRLVIVVPPLRERPEDIEPLVAHFLDLAGAQLGRRELSEDAMRLLHGHPWPGNVRSLRNVVMQAAALSSGPTVSCAEVRKAFDRILGPKWRPEIPAQLYQVLDRHQGNLSAAARSLGIPRSTFRDRLRAEAEDQVG